MGAGAGIRRRLDRGPAPRNSLPKEVTRMFFAPAIRNDALMPAAGGLDFGFERFMNEAFKGLGSPYSGLEEDEKAWTLTVDVPGIAKEQLSVNVERNVVRVESTREAARSFKGVYELPHPIDVEGSEAKLEHGVLTLKLAKVEQPDNSRQIAIR
jgi:HSP20 family protein